MKISLLTTVVLMISGLCSQARSLEEIFAERGYVSVTATEPDIMVSLMYARDDNFTGVVLYDDSIKDAWLHPDAAKALARAQRELGLLMPGCHLLVKDAARPMSVQRRMFNAVKGTPKANYVANPARGGGLHNYGVAVDVTIADENGNELDMGTPVDHLGVEANIDRELHLVKTGVISENARQNRLLLRKVMKNAGFSTIRTEWWHFDLVSKARAKQLYKLLDF